MRKCRGVLVASDASVSVYRWTDIVLGFICFNSFLTF